MARIQLPKQAALLAQGELEFEKVRAARLRGGWPGIEEGTSYGTPALKVGKKLLCRWREPGVLVVACDIDEKEILKQAWPSLYFEIPHYFVYQAILLKLDEVKLDELVERLEIAWRRVADPKAVAEFDRLHP